MTLIITLKHRTMKYSGLFFAAAISAVMAACSGQKTMEFPVTDTVIDWMSVYKVTFADTATVVEGNFYGRPGYELKKPAGMFYLRGQSDGAEYRLLGTSFAGDTVYVRFPDNWTVPFTFVFSPLKKGEESFDLVCGDKAIKGIRSRDTKAGYTTVIKGTLIDRPNTSRLILGPYGFDARVDPYISIPVENGEFSYCLKTDEQTVYQLICYDEYCSGVRQTLNLFSDGGEIDLRISPFSWTEYEFEIDGTTSAANREYLSYTDSIGRIKPGHREDMIVRYCEENTGIVGYFGILWNYPHSSGKFKAAYRELFETVYSKKYPDHPFTEQMYNAIASEEIRPGGHFIDFSAPDLSGKVHTLSEEISGKVAVIDLWASWCGPCRRHSMALIPVYEEYKDKGFTVVGVAREQNGTEAMEAAIRKDGYPWLNLVELNDAGHIWEKYGAGNAGGRIVLVDANGIIMAVDPTADEVLEYLGSHCF